MRKTILIFSALCVALLVLFQLNTYKVMSGDLRIEWALAITALVFLFIGIALRKKRADTEKTAQTQSIDAAKIEQLGISKREYEVLLKLSKGLSNKEIAEALFVSESTVKTHVSNLYVKLDAKRRTQALQKAKEYRILPL